MMLASAAGLVNRFPSDAHDARSRCRVGQEVSVLMLMMLAPAAGLTVSLRWSIVRS